MTCSPLIIPSLIWFDWFYFLFISFHFWYWGKLVINIILRNIPWRVCNTNTNLWPAGCGVDNDISQSNGCNSYWWRSRGQKPKPKGIIINDEKVACWERYIQNILYLERLEMKHTRFIIHIDANRKLSHRCTIPYHVHAFKSSKSLTWNNY